MRRMSRAQRLPLVGRIAPGARSIGDGIAARVGGRRALEIADLLQRKPAQLSGGQRQRVAVGRAMVRDPKVFLMDEPLSNLDAKLRVHMRAELADLHRRLRATFIYVTHDQSEAMTMSDRVAVMMDGALLQVGPPAALYAAPVNLRVAEFVGSPKINVVPGIVATAATVRALDLALPLAVAAPVGAAIQLGLRSEALSPQRRRRRRLRGARAPRRESRRGLLRPRRGRRAGGAARRARRGSCVAEFPRRRAALILPDPAQALVFDASGERVERRASRRRDRRRMADPPPDAALARARRRRRRQENLAALGLAGPASLLLFLLLLGPTLAVLLLSLTDWQFGARTMRFIGLGNYAEMFADRVFRLSLVNTLIYVAVTVPVSVALGLGTALLIELRPRCRASTARSTSSR